MEQKYFHPKPRNIPQTVERITLFSRWLAKPSMNQDHESNFGLKFVKSGDTQRLRYMKTNSFFKKPLPSRKGGSV
jgi:hypothetical protein